jgi:hypothetical protein
VVLAQEEGISMPVLCLTILALGHREGTFGDRQGNSVALNDIARHSSSVCSKWLTDINKLWTRTQHNLGFQSSGDEYTALHRSTKSSALTVRDKHILTVWFDQATPEAIDRTFHEAVGFWMKRGRIQDMLGCRLRTGPYANQLSVAEKKGVLPNLLIGRFVPGVFCGSESVNTGCVDDDAKLETESDGRYTSCRSAATQVCSLLCTEI